MNQWQAFDTTEKLTAWRLTGSEFTIIVRPFQDGEGGWLATCHALDIDGKVLQSTGDVAAKREAVRLVVAGIRRMAAEAERVFAKHGRAKLSEEDGDN